MLHPSPVATSGAAGSVAEALARGGIRAGSLADCRAFLRGIADAAVTNGSPGGAGTSAEDVVWKPIGAGIAVSSPDTCTVVPTAAQAIRLMCLSEPLEQPPPDIAPIQLLAFVVAPTLDGARELTTRLADAVRTGKLLSFLSGQAACDDLLSRLNRIMPAAASTPS